MLDFSKMSAKNVVFLIHFSQEETAELAKVEEEDDGGSLNLKIVDVVSLKDQDQENLLDINAVPPQKPMIPMEALASNAMATKSIHGTELRIPQYLTATTTNLAPIMHSGNSSDPNAELYKHLLKNVRPPQLSFPVQTPVKSVVAPGKLANTFKCEKCHVHAPQLAAMVAHLRNTHKEIPRLFQCPYCKDMEAESEALIHQHIKLNHPSDNPNPPVALSEPAKRNLKTICVQLPDGSKLGDGGILERDIYKCLNCNIHSYSLETIYNHLEQNHPQVFVFMCPFCKEYKSKTETGVCAHILHVHRKSTADVNISIAIDGTQFTRVQCLVKDKAKKQHSPAGTAHQKSHTVSSAYQDTGPKPTNSIPNHFGNANCQPVFTRISHIPTPTRNHLQTLAAVTQNFPKQATVQPQIPPVPSPMASQPATGSLTTVSTSSQQAKSTQPAPKKKKNLLESIAQLKVQKELEQQGLIPPKSSASGSAQTSLSASKTVSSVPPPLMRAPPPLIRYDQLNKISSSLSVVSPTVKMSTAGTGNKQTTSISQDTLSTLQRLQSLSGPKTSVAANANPPRPIHSSLFDTSDMGPGKANRPVLNVPVIPRATGSPSPGNVQSPRPAEAAGVLDLSAKNTPVASPVSKNSPSPKQQHANLPKDGVNPELFKVFNLRPNMPMQLSRPVGPQGQAVVTQQILVPQQVRHNTPSTLAYRPPGPHMVATSQIPQIINMPMGAVLGNMVVSIGSLPGGVQSIQGIPTQLVHVATPPVPVSGMVTASSASQGLPITNPGQPSQAAPLFNMQTTMFRCPYCPKVVPLTFSQVPAHIESQHPGSSILLLPMESQ